MNIKSRGKSAERSKSAKDQSNLEPKVSEKDNESLYKELLKEVCGKKKKKEINWEVVKKLQRLTFSSRRDSILEISGSGIVSKIMEKFPFLDNETCLWNELEFCVSEETDEDVGADVFAKQWEQIAKCFLKEDVGNDDICSAALETMPKEFNSASSPLQSFIPDHTSLETFLKNLETNDPQLISYKGNASEGVEDPSSIQIFIVVDKEVLLECKTPSGRDAFISLLAVHYALNLKYHATHTFMYKFIEEHVLGMMPRRKSYAYKKIENALLSKLTDCSAD